MEMNEDGLLEELLGLRRERAWEANPSSTTDDEMNGLLSTTSWAFDGLDSTLPNNSTTSYGSFSCSINHKQQVATTLDCSNCNFSQGIDLYPGPLEAGVRALQEPDYSMICKAEHSMSSAADSPPAFNIGTGKMWMEKSVKNKVKKVEGQPSKNLMAERRRRKRLNDRLSMLRSVVPKISKMDRTSILGDTIDYMKELLQRINNLQGDQVDVGSNQFDLMGYVTQKPNDSLVRNSPKFDVERRKLDTRLEMCCAGKPGLLLSTVTTLEAMGLEIQQCVISCFNDFSLQASCSEEVEQKTLINTEDIKQAMFRNAGYGGRCL
nr:hypothetical protein [Suaeda aralocaspica]